MPAFQRLDDAVGYRGRIVAAADQAADTHGRIDRAPPLRGKIDGNEQVAREQRRRDGLDAPRVPASLQITRKINLKTLAVEMQGRFCLSVWLSMGDKPARSEFACHGAPPVGRLTRIPNS